MSTAGFPILLPKANAPVRRSTLGAVYVSGQDAQIDASLKAAHLDGQGKSWWDVRDALCDAGDRAAAGRAESLAIPF